MAEVNVDSLIIPDKSESGGSVSSDNGCSILLRYQRVSFSSEDDVNNLRRNSTGNPSPLSSNQKIVPHYLRASTGSCHDFCKYGRKEAFEEKKRYPLRKRTIRAPSDKQKSVVTTAQGERKQSMAFKNTTSPDSKSSSLLGPEAVAVVVQSPDPPEIIKREVSTSKKFEVSSKSDLSGEKKMLKTEKTINSSSEKHFHSAQPQMLKQSEKMNGTSSEKHSPSLQPELMKQSKKKMTTTLEELSPSMQPKLRKQSRKKMNKISEKLPSSEEPQLIKQSSSSYALKSGKKTQNAEKGMKILSKKISPSPQPQPVAAKSLPSSQIPGGINRRGGRQNFINTSKNTAVSGSPAKKPLIPPTNSLFTGRSTATTISLKAGKTRGSKLMSSPVSRNSTEKAEVEETNTGKVPEKTLHVVETDTKNSLPEHAGDNYAVPSLPSQSYLSPDSLSEPQSSSLPSHEEEEEEEEETEEEEEEEEEIEEEEGEENGKSCGEAEDLIPENNTTANTNGIKAVEENHRKTLRKGTILSESKNSAVVKLKFRRGKVVDVRSENNGPRRLRFRLARIVEEKHDSKNEIRRKLFKKRGDEGDGNDNNASDKKVVLRHQDTQGKKDAQGLFNNVIEETASKLVESRKSKVKALVGAFETVISLQESKPSSQPVTSL